VAGFCFLFVFLDLCFLDSHRPGRHGDRTRGLG
jgi:hypothetical protein